MKDQAPFLAFRERQQWDTLWNKLVDARDLDYAVLMAHVLIYEELCHLLGARLRTDSLPHQMPGFMNVMDLALAGSTFAEDRKTLGYLNTARNLVAHRSDRAKFESDARMFAERSWNDDNEEYRVDGFEWASDEKEKVEAVRVGFFVWQAKLADIESEFSKADTEPK